MRMRQIERLFSLRHKLLEYPSIKSVRLSIWGSLKDKEYAHSLLSHANESSQEEFKNFMENIVLKGYSAQSRSSILWDSLWMERTFLIQV